MINRFATHFRSALVGKLICSLLLVILLGGALPARSTNGTARVRGLVLRQGSGGNYPASYIQVTIAPYSSPAQRSGMYTGSDGMYYFDVAMGDYILEVWQSKDRSVKKFLINANKERVDVAPIVLP